MYLNFTRLNINNSLQLILRVFSCTCYIYIHVEFREKLNFLNVQNEYIVYIAVTKREK